MAQKLKFTVNNSGKEFRLIVGDIKSDMNLPPEEKEKRVNDRASKTLKELKMYLKDNEDEEIVISGFGYID